VAAALPVSVSVEAGQGTEFVVVLRGVVEDEIPGIHACGRGTREAAVVTRQSDIAQAELDDGTGSREIGRDGTASEVDLKVSGENTGAGHIANQSCGLNANIETVRGLVEGPHGEGVCARSATLTDEQAVKNACHRIHRIAGSQIHGSAGLYLKRGIHAGTEGQNTGAVEVQHGAGPSNGKVIRDGRGGPGKGPVAAAHRGIRSGACLDQATGQEACASAGEGGVDSVGIDSSGVGDGGTTGAACIERGGHRHVDGAVRTLAGITDEAERAARQRDTISALAEVAGGATVVAHGVEA
jgi:hypothetical protein